MYEKIDKELLEYVEDVLLNRCSNATERMLEYAATVDPKSKPTALRKLNAQPAVPAFKVRYLCFQPGLFPKQQLSDSSCL